MQFEESVFTVQTAIFRFLGVSLLGPGKLRTWPLAEFYVCVEILADKYHSVITCTGGIVIRHVCLFIG